MRMQCTRRIVAAAVLLAVLPAVAESQATFRDEAVRVTVEPNVIYGMVSGLALLMDVYRSDRPNGRRRGARDSATAGASRAP